MFIKVYEMFTLIKMKINQVNIGFEKLLIVPYNSVKIISKTSKYFYPKRKIKCKITGRYI